MLTNPAAKVALGLDFGTESVRALIVDLAGQEVGIAVAPYRFGQILEHLPGASDRLPRDFALQHPGDWLDSAAAAIRDALTAAGASAEQIAGIGVDFTSCTMLPVQEDGMPLAMLEPWKSHPYAWPKLWKHHAAKAQTARLNEVASDRNEPWLARYGGSIGLEWFFPKVLETLECAPEVYEATDVWLEAGDWFVWQLVGGPASALPRSTCQAGYKAMWSRENGYPSEEFFKALHPRMEGIVAEKLPGRFVPPGELAGYISPTAATRLGLHEGTPVSAAIIDAHAGVPGAGADGPGALVMVMGTSSCHMLNSDSDAFVPGVAGVVKDGILSGFYGYETGQAAVGDAFEWLRRLVGSPDFTELTLKAAEIPYGSEGVRCVDWFHGCRTPLMDGSLTGAFTGLTLHHKSAHLFRAAMEASACGVRWIVDSLREGGVPVDRFIATGGLPHHNPVFMRICADVLGRPILVPASSQGPALGAAILGALAGSCFPDARSAIQAMASNAKVAQVIPNREAHAACAEIYADYRTLTAYLSTK